MYLTKFKKMEDKEDQYICTKCDYKTILKKHNIRKPKDHLFKKCRNYLLYFMKLLKYVENFHTKEPVGKNEAKGFYEKDDLNKHVEKKEKIESRSQKILFKKVKYSRIYVFTCQL